MAKAINKPSASDIARNVAASVKEAARLKEKIKGLQDKLHATEDRIHCLEANLKDVEKIAAEVHAEIRKPAKSRIGGDRATKPGGHRHDSGGT